MVGGVRCQTGLANFATGSSSSEPETIIPTTFVKMFIYIRVSYYSTMHWSKKTSWLLIIKYSTKGKGS
jgi:hypothetical protein